VYGCYFTSSPVCIPPTRGCWYHSLIVDTQDISLKPRYTRSTSTLRFFQSRQDESTRLPTHSTKRIQPSSPPMTTTLHQSSSSSVATNNDTPVTRNDSDDEEVRVVQNDNNNIIQQLRTQNRWHSPEALKQFLFNPTVEELNRISNNQEVELKRILRSNLSRLRDGWMKASGWRENISGSEELKDRLDERQVFQIRKQCKYLALTIDSILSNYHNTTYKSICTSVCRAVYDSEQLNNLGNNDDIGHYNMLDESTIRRWYLEYKKMTTTY
jgi:hypothetical protein